MRCCWRSSCFAGHTGNGISLSATRASRLAKYRFRYVLRSRMNASSSASATMAATMAFTTNAAGFSLHSLSKMDSITQSEVRIRSVLGALLIRGIACDVLTGVYQDAQSAAIRLRSESPDLVDLCEIFGAGGEKYISGQPPLAPIRKWKPQAHHSGRPPFRPGP